MKFSLILATVNRDTPLIRCLRSLAGQTFVDFEVIIVDQNTDDRLGPIIAAERGSLRVSRIRSAGGASKARNAGLAVMQGEIATFPDDDCWYEPDTLERLAAIYAANPSAAGVASRLRGPGGEINMGMRDLSPGVVTPDNAFWRCNTNVLSARRDALERIHGFDEAIGPGNGKPWGSAEDVDLAMRVIASGGTVLYAPDDFVVHHPLYNFHDDPKAIERALAYGKGCGHVLRRHGAKWSLIGYMVARPLAAAAVTLLRGRARKAQWYFAMCRGRLAGVLASPGQKSS